MRIINKYKYIDQIKEDIRIPSRALKFRKSKWIYIKKQYLKIDRQKRKLQKARSRRYENTKNYISTGIFRNIQKNGVPNQKWEKVRRDFKNFIEFNRYILLLNNSNKRERSKLSKLLKNYSKSRQDYIKYLYFKRLFSIDYFLYYTYLTSSVQESRQFLEQNLISKNKNKYLVDKKLNKGDILSFDNKDYSFISIKSKFKLGKCFNSFYEYDYYTQTFVLLKDLSEINERDLALIDKRYI